MKSYNFESDNESHLNGADLSELSDYFEEDGDSTVTSSTASGLINLPGIVQRGASSLSLDDIPYDRDLKWINVPNASRPKPTLLNRDTGSRLIKQVEAITAGNAHELKNLVAHYRMMDAKKRDSDKRYSIHRSRDIAESDNQGPGREAFTGHGTRKERDNSKGKQQSFDRNVPQVQSAHPQPYRGEHGHTSHGKHRNRTDSPAAVAGYGRKSPRQNFRKNERGDIRHYEQPLQQPQQQLQQQRYDSNQQFYNDVGDAYYPLYEDNAGVNDRMVMTMMGDSGHLLLPNDPEQMVSSPPPPPPFNQHEDSTAASLRLNPNANEFVPSFLMHGNT